MDSLHWQKNGQILSLISKNKPDWMSSHAQNPSPVLFDDCIRVYFNTRPVPSDKCYVSHPAFVDLDRNDPQKIINMADRPVLDLGEKGCFDHFGCMATSIIENGNELWMYYVGWTRGIEVPYNWSIGLAVSRDGGNHFERMFKGPIIGAYLNEPFLQNGQFVLREAPDLWHMWYSTGKKWIEHKGKMEAVYVIVYARSKDGIRWHRTGNPLIPYAIKNETQTTPTVFYWNHKYHMIFSSRHSEDFRNAERGYRLGYACWSHKFKSWCRDDTKVGIAPSDSGWDAEMICYPHVINVDGKHYLFYCGNDFGRDGFGYASLIEETKQNK